LELTHSISVLEYFQIHKPDFVLHLAAKSGAADLNKLIPVDMFEKNLKMLMNILHAATVTNVSRIVLISSTAAYPAQRKLPARETDLHAGPPSTKDYPYAFAKRMMEPLASAYRNQYGLNISVAIVNGIMGPAMNFKNSESVMLAGLIRRFYEQQQFGMGTKPYLVHGDGSPIREYTSSLDLAKALFWLLDQESMPELINIGNSEGFSIRQWAEFVCEYLKIDKSLLVFSEPIRLETMQYNQQTDNSQFVKLANFKYTDAKLAIAITAEWFVMNYANIKS